MDLLRLYRSLLSMIVSFGDGNKGQEMVNTSIAKPDHTRPI